MAIEYEATFLNIDKDKLRIQLEELGGKLIRPEYMQRRYNFDLQSLGRNFWEWVRIRDEGNKITMAYKCIPPNASMAEQREIEFEISDMESAADLMKSVGARMTNYSETLRERWLIDDVNIDLDSWPHLEPFVEIEGKSEKDVNRVSKLLGFDPAKAKFCGAGEIYEMKYGIHPDKISKDKVIRLTFNDTNPFITDK